jgi:hypothetical protein
MHPGDCFKAVNNIDNGIGIEDKVIVNAMLGNIKNGTNSLRILCYNVADIMQLNLPRILQKL